MKAKLVSESINFERGKDPMTSMDIGKIYTDKERIRSIEWSIPLNFDLLFDGYHFYKFIESYKGYPILVFMGGTGDWNGISSESTNLYVGPYNAKEKTLSAIKDSITNFILNR